MYNNFDIMSNNLVSTWFDDPTLYYKQLNAPPIFQLISPEDELELFNICKSGKSVRLKYKLIDAIILKYPYFKRIGAGTNRIIYRNLNHRCHVIKVAFDRTALQDGPKEFINQNYLYPFCTKIFEVSPNNVITSSEYVEQISDYDEFGLYYKKVWDTLKYRFLDSGFFMDDVGFAFYKNWGVRFGTPVLLDFPYVFRIDKIQDLKCDNVLDNGEVCTGTYEIDDTFDYLYCPKCGKDKIPFSKIGKDVHEIYGVSIEQSFDLYNGETLYSPRVQIIENGKVILDSKYTNVKTEYISNLKEDERTIDELLDEIKEEDDMKVSIVYGDDVKFTTNIKDEGKMEYTRPYKFKKNIKEGIKNKNKIFLPVASVEINGQTLDNHDEEKFEENNEVEIDTELNEDNVSVEIESDIESDIENSDEEYEEESNEDIINEVEDNNIVELEESDDIENDTEDDNIVETENEINIPQKEEEISKDDDNQGGGFIPDFLKSNTDEEDEKSKSESSIMVNGVPLEEIEYNEFGDYEYEPVGNDVDDQYEEEENFDNF